MQKVLSDLICTEFRWDVTSISLKRIVWIILYLNKKRKCNNEPTHWEIYGMENDWMVDILLFPVIGTDISRCNTNALAGTGRIHIYLILKRRTMVKSIFCLVKILSHTAASAWRHLGFHCRVTLRLEDPMKFNSFFIFLFRFVVNLCSLADKFTQSSHSWWCFRRIL